MVTDMAWAQPTSTSDDDSDVLDDHILGTLYGLLARPAWHRKAACRGLGPRRFYPSTRVLGTRGRAALTRTAAICDSCPVRDECDNAGSHEKWGVWAGVDRTTHYTPRKYRER